MGEYQNYNDDVQTIKEAILRTQYETGCVANANQLAFYYGIGGYASAKSRADK